MTSYWNPETFEVPSQLTVADETLRDGLQSPSVRHPSLEEKKYIIKAMQELGIDAVDLGLPGAGDRFQREVRELLRVIQEKQYSIRPYCATRTHPHDVQSAIDVAETVGYSLEVTCYIGSSPIRQLVEDWSIEGMQEMTEDAISTVREAGLPASFVTEDTTRAHPDDIRRLYRTAIDAGAERLLLCDTVGHATPEGVQNLFQFVQNEVLGSDEAVELVFHGHQDRGLGVANSLAAIRSGANEVHGCSLGLGERSGNTPMEPLLAQLDAFDLVQLDRSKLRRYSITVSEYTDRSIPDEWEELY